ncbi:hypothetical protein BMH32_07125, partial [Leucobacter sp. OLJS4]
MTDPRPEDRPAEQPADQAEPQAAPADPRPRPAYGEYAPEGWSWTPPQEASAADPAGSRSGPD